MSDPTKPVGRRTKAAATFIDDQLKVGRVGFQLAQLVAATGLSLEAAKSQLRRLGNRVVRVSPAQAFFLIVTPENQATGAPPIDWWLDDYFTWLEHPYYLALQSAAGVLGANPQAIQVTQVMTDTPRRPIELGRLKMVFFVKRGIAGTPTQPLPNAFAPTRVSTPAVTVFDLVRYAPRIGGIGRAIETIRPLLPTIDVADLRATLAAENEIATTQRLGYILEKTGQARLAGVIEAWLPGKRPITPLVSRPTRPEDGPLVPRWRVVDNSGEFNP
ncbi:MAG: hypothetical protein RL091_799 [Verrucomicrobiota bacterium]|jgi:hypothetical protein